MIAVLSAYIKNIGLLMIFMAFVGMIVPNGSFKGTVNVALGFLLILALLQPVVSLFRGEALTYDVLMRTFTLPTPADESLGIQTDGNLQKELLNLSYQAMVQKETQSLLAHEGYGVQALEVTYDEETGQIYTLSLALEEQAKDAEKNGFIYIEPVTVRSPFVTQENDMADITGTSPEIKNIKNTISDFYNVPEDNIYITVQRKTQGR